MQLLAPRVCSGFAFSSEKSLGSVDVVIPVGVDLREIFQQTMQWLLSAGLPFLVVLLLFFSLETVTFLF